MQRLLELLGHPAAAEPAQVAAGRGRNGVVRVGLGKRRKVSPGADLVEDGLGTIAGLGKRLLVGIGRQAKQDMACSHLLGNRELVDARLVGAQERVFRKHDGLADRLRLDARS